MERWSDKPLKFSEVLDLTFYIFRKNFVKLFLIALIFLGPGYLLLAVTQPQVSGIDYLNGLDLSSMQDIYSSYYTGGNMALYLLISYILAFILIPISYASLIFAVNQIKNNEEVQISPVIKNALKRYFPLLGGGIVYFLVVFGIILGVVLVITLLLALMGETTQAILLAVLLGIIAFLGLIYLLVRWSFNYVAIVFEKVSPGLSKSWRLTRGNFWRLFGIYIVLSLIIGILIFVLQLPVQLLVNNTVIVLLVTYLLSIIATVITLIAYTILYFDLRLRNEAVDLKEMVNDYPNGENKEIL